MKNEIKEKMTIGKAKKILKGFLEKDCYYDTPLYYAIPYLLDYITNLQQAVKNTKETADDMLYELNEENEIVHKDFEELSQRYFFTKSKIEKAIEYIEECYTQPPNIENFMHEGEMNYLLNILRGKDNE